MPTTTRLASKQAILHRVPRPSKSSDAASRACLRDPAATARPPRASPASSAATGQLRGAAIKASKTRAITGPGAFNLGRRSGRPANAETLCLLSGRAPGRRESANAPMMDLLLNAIVVRHPARRLLCRGHASAWRSRSACSTSSTSPIRPSSSWARSPPISLNSTFRRSIRSWPASSMMPAFFAARDG